MDTRHKQKRQNLKQYKRRRNIPPGNLPPDSAIQGIIATDESDDSDNRQFSRKLLQSNWSRYDEPSDEDDCDEVGSDFRTLAQQPPSLSGHFRFNSEKDWEKEMEEPACEGEFNKYFTLNLGLLNAGLKTIPFYKRFEYDRSMFDPEDIRRMEAEAEAAESNYQEVLKRHEDNRKNPGRVQSGRSSAKAKAEAGPSRPGSSTKPPAATDEGDGELDELLKMTTNSLSKVEIAGKKEDQMENNVKEKMAVTANDSEKNDEEANCQPLNAEETKEDMQDWLDNILED